MPMRLVDWGTLEQLLLLRRKQSINLEDLPEHVRSSLADQIKADRSVPINELIHYASTREGASWRLWLSLRTQYPHCQCVKWVDTLAEENRLGEYLAVSLQIDGLDTFADMDWPRMPYAEELASMNSGKQSVSVDWKVHTNAVAELYGVGPHEFGELTYYQARLLLWDREALSGKFKISREQAKHIATLSERQKLYAQKLAAQKSASSPLTE